MFVVVEERHHFLLWAYSGRKKISTVMDPVADTSTTTTTMGTSFDAALELEELEAMRSRRLSPRTHTLYRRNNEIFRRWLVARGYRQALDDDDSVIPANLTKEMVERFVISR